MLHLCILPVFDDNNSSVSFFLYFYLPLLLASVRQLSVLDSMHQYGIPVPFHTAGKFFEKQLKTFSHSVSIRHVHHHLFVSKNRHWQLYNALYSIILL